MAPWPRVQCSCKCGDFVTTEVEGKHLQKVYFAKRMPVPSIVRKRPSMRQPSPPDSGPPLRATPERPSPAPASFSCPASPDIDNNPVPESEDPASLWARVMATRIQLQAEDDEPEGSELSAATAFVSQPGSDNSAEPTDPPQGRFNPATYGISPGELLKGSGLLGQC
ncbi:hypothetical protein B0J17DRAFT_725451 [Rhizoctonia solani]|nr:hypothetical protein B0J17DRAFT_725451 [Rhizoctonia solani]